ncbi:hypothetical protein EG329_005760 [Mollisiaceae sp. DMI_Dod_QoI]|nr:hypothetical protein EG329_005760 [Helotiales sp. DMI_Dod_QoI]
MLRSRKSKVRPDSQQSFAKAELHAIQEEIAPSTKSRLNIARLGPKLLSSLIATLIATSALSAGYLSGDWDPTYYVLILECLVGIWMLFEAIKQRMKMDIEALDEKKRDLVMDLPI